MKKIPLIPNSVYRPAAREAKYICHVDVGYMVWEEKTASYLGITGRVEEVCWMQLNIWMFLCAMLGSLLVPHYWTKPQLVSENVTCFS